MSDILNIISAFNTLGIDESEYLIYQTVLASPPVSISKLASDTNLSRTTLYTYLDQMTKKGILIKTTNHPKKYKYTAINPDKLLELVKNNKKNIEQSFSVIENHIEYLRDIQNIQSDRNEPGIQVIRGNKTNDELDHLIMKVNKPCAGFSYIYHLDSCFAFDKNGELVANDYLDMILKVSDKFVFPATPTIASKVSRFIDKHPFLKDKWFPRWLPESEFKFGINFYTFGTYVAFSMGQHQEKDYLAYIINNQEIADSMNSLVNYLWNKAIII